MIGLSTGAAHHPGPMRLVGSPPPGLGRSRRAVGRCLVALGALLLVAAFGFLVAPGEGLAAFVPSDPAVASVGFTPGADGKTRIVMDRTAAHETTELELYSGDPYADSGRLVWSAEKTDRAPSSWADDLSVGQTPSGFVVTKPLTVPLGRVSAVEITNGCFGAPSFIPGKADLHPGKVTFSSDDDTQSLVSVAAAQGDSGDGYTSCVDDRTTEINGVVGLWLIGGGALLLPVGIAVLRAGRRAADMPSAGWFRDPQDRGRLRWWDGSGWASATRAD